MTREDILSKIDSQMQDNMGIQDETSKFKGERNNDSEADVLKKAIEMTKNGEINPPDYMYIGFDIPVKQPIEFGKYRGQGLSMREILKRENPDLVDEIDKLDMGIFND